MNYNTADIRRFLIEAFSDEELSTLCFDFFPEVSDDFAVGITKGQKIQLLIEYCQRREVVPNLLAALQRVRPEQYEKRFPLIPQQVPPESPKLQRDPKQVFISHAHEDAEFAHRLAGDLQQHDWRVWIAPESIRPGEKWVEAINRGLEESGAFALVLTPAAIKSRWVKDETNVAIELEHEGRVRFVPLDVENCDVPPLWRAYQRVSFCSDYVSGLRSLVFALDPAQRDRQLREEAARREAERLEREAQYKAMREELERKARVVEAERRALEKVTKEKTNHEVDKAAQEQLAPKVQMISPRPSPRSTPTLKSTTRTGVVESRPRRLPPLVWVGLLALVLLGVSVVVPNIYTQLSKMMQFETLLSGAHNDATQAATLRDQTARRARWASAYTQAVAALEVRPGATEARQIRDDAQRALDQIDNVVRLKTSLLWDFKTPGPRRLAAQGVNLFVLDRTANRVFQLTLNEAGDGVTDRGEPPTRAYKSQNVSDRQVGDLIDLVWMSAGGARTRSSLLVLDSGGLLEYDLAWNVTSVSLGQAPVPLGARAVAVFGGNLYVLDPATSHLWRYRPQGSGYAAAESYFDPPSGDLTAAIDVGMDGSVYVLHADGRIRRFFGGKERPFAASGIADPIKRPVALSADAEARQGAVYVADAGGARIVKLNTDGAFVQQLRAIGDAFDALEDILVDERGGRLFVMSGGRLYSARLPVTTPPSATSEPTKIPEPTTAPEPTTIPVP